MKQQSAAKQSDSSLPVRQSAGRLLQRKCACGTHTISGSNCQECSRSSSEQTLRRSLLPDRQDSAAVPDVVHEVLRSPGKPLEAATRSFMETRIGHDFSGIRAHTASPPVHSNLVIGRTDDPAEKAADRVADAVMRPSSPGGASMPAGYDFSRVRVHTDAKAAQSAQSVGALAYTVGDHVVFGGGQYAPGTSGGAKLLAHELAHVAQQTRNLIRRVPDAATLATFDQRVAAVRAHPTFRALRGEALRLANDIIRVARTRDNCLYYIDNLTQLISTPDAPRTGVATTVAQQTGQEAAAEQQRLATPEGQRLVGVEESISSDPARRWIQRRGQDGTIFYVDNSDPNNIVVRARVRLVRRGRGTSQDVLNIRSLEDSIEKAASTGGYTVNLEFVDRAGRDVFTVGVDTSQWTTSGNWVGTGQQLAHELHHLFGLDDRYDYIEAHARNATMVMADRLYWFRQQMNRASDPLIHTSIMGSGERPVDDDVCRVAGLNVAACTGIRGGIRTARANAFSRTFRAWEVLSGIRPASPADRFGGPTQNELAQARAASLADTILGQPVSFTQVTTLVGSMRYRLTPDIRIEVAPATDPECAGNRSSYTRSMSPPVRLCPQFFTDSEELRTRALIRESAHMVRISDGRGEALCASYDCQTPCGGFNNADAWSHLIHCLNNRAPERRAATPQSTGTGTSTTPTTPTPTTGGQR